VIAWAGDYGPERGEVRKCVCGRDQNVNWITVDRETMPDLSRMNRHDRRAMEVIARKYKIDLRKAKPRRFT
jgi:hypothetical protein